MGPGERASERNTYTYTQGRERMDVVERMKGPGGAGASLP